MAHVNKHLPSVSGLDLQSKAARKTSLLKRKAKKYSYGAVISHIVIASLIVGMVVLGYQPPVNGADASVSSVADLGTNPSAVPTVDQVASANMASVAAQTANVIVANDVVSYATSVNIQSQLAQTDTAVVSKPQILTANSGQNGVRIYVTQPSDTVPSVAAANSLTPDTIRWANNLTSDALTPGTNLKIPGVDGVVYTVKAGDTSDSLATKYKSEANRITTYNNDELTGLQPGQQIVIPGGVPPLNERPGYVAPAQYYYNGGGGASYAIGGHVNTYGGNGYGFGQCTWYVYNRRAELGRSVGGMWGNASQWAYSARQSGYLVDHNPEVGAVMQSNEGYFGHVAVVEQVNADGSISISEMNYYGGRGTGWDIKSSRTIDAGQARAYDYIH